MFFLKGFTSVFFFLKRFTAVFFDLLALPLTFTEETQTHALLGYAKLYLVNKYTIAGENKLSVSFC